MLLHDQFKPLHAILQYLHYSIANSRYFIVLWTPVSRVISHSDQDSSEPGEPGDPAMVGADDDWLPDLEVVNMDVAGDEVIVGPDVMDDDVIIPELDVGRLSLSEPAQNLEEKQDVLERVRRNGVSVGIARLEIFQGKKIEIVPVLLKSLAYVRLLFHLSRNFPQKSRILSGFFFQKKFFRKILTPWSECAR